MRKEDVKEHKNITNEVSGKENWIIIDRYGKTKHNRCQTSYLGNIMKLTKTDWMKKKLYTKRKI